MAKTAVLSTALSRPYNCPIFEHRMKRRFYCLEIAVLLAMAQRVEAQGTFIYDQQSSTNETPIPGAGAVIQQLTPYGQSFTPSLSAVSFIRLNLSDYSPNNGLGVTLYLNLGTNTINGFVLATTPLVTLSDGFAGTVDFNFSSDVPLVPASPYAFEIVIQSGDLWNAVAGELNYPGGMVFAHGAPAPASDLWFREGIVPEPSAALLALLGGSVLIWFTRRMRRR